MTSRPPLTLHLSRSCLRVDQSADKSWVAACCKVFNSLFKVFVTNVARCNIVHIQKVSKSVARITAGVTGAKSKLTWSHCRNVAQNLGIGTVVDGTDMSEGDKTGEATRNKENQCQVVPTFLGLNCRFPPLEKAACFNRIQTGFHSMTQK
ncbi:hypothetical protein GOODEAATRI_013801 [Goodea atripinnis]|uniref:Uncharacterized protein n=1 Tax=Goodea atripinnis TaxID=208336 RepID=A0ABV0NUE2_9TELE